MTGFVALNENGEILKAKELTGVGEDPVRMITLIDEIVRHLQPDDVICIESPANNAKGKYVGQMFAIAWGIRMSLVRRGWKYIDVAPSQVKKFASGKGNASKDDLIIPIFKKWGFEHNSDNVRDAYILAQIAVALNTHEYDQYHNYQLEVVQAILNPSQKKKSKKTSKSKGANKQ